MHNKKLWKRLTSGTIAAVLTLTAIPLWKSDQVQAAISSTTNAVATLSVDMEQQLGKVLHSASGFLYGVSSEDVPTANTIVPLNAKVLATKGALGTEHPYGDALDVAKTFLESGGEQVMMYNSNYYGVFGVMTDYKIYGKDLETKIAPAVVKWKKQWNEDHGTPESPKDAIGARVDIDKAIIYIPVNEGTPNWGAKDFGVAWEEYCRGIKAGDPNAVIGGTNDWYYNMAFGFKHEEDYKVVDIPEGTSEEDQKKLAEEINTAEKNARSKDKDGNEQAYNLDDFIPYCIANDCMPDIITWHELDPDALVKMADHKADFIAKWNKYWKEAGKTVPEVPQIVINEYATGYDCGIPGRLVNWAARLEDNEMYGCLPFWHQANDLNDLAADANEGNGAWWAFKWYGDMSGQRLKVDSTAYYDELYGLAAIDEEKESAKILYGGEDGAGNVVLNNLNKTKTFKDSKFVHIKVEAASYVGMEGSEYAPPTVIEGDFAVDSKGSVSVSMQNMKFSTAYCMTVTKTEATEEADYLSSAYINYYEAEDAKLSGNASVLGAKEFASGEGEFKYFGPSKYWSNDEGVWMKKGGKLTYSIQVPTDGRYKLTFVYGNGTGTLRNDAQSSIGHNQIQTMEADNGEPVQMTMANTLLTNNTGNHVEYVDLAAGAHAITVESVDDTPDGEVLHDLMVVSYDSAFGEGGMRLYDTYEAEDADFNTLTSNNTYKTNTVSSVQKGRKLVGYSGSGYVNGLSDVSVVDGGGIRWTVVVKESGLYNLELRYQSKKAGDARIYLGNTDTTLTNLAKTLPLAAADGEWGDAVSTIYLQKGINIIDLDATEDISLDYMQIRQLDEAQTSELVRVIEAENCIPSQGEGQYTIVDSAGASAGKYVKGMEGSKDAKTTLGQYLEFSVPSEAAGYYQLQIFQSNDELCGSHSYNTKIIDKYMSVSVTDQTGTELSDNRYFFINTYSKDTFREKTVTLYLNQGENKIRIYNDDSWNVLYGGTQSVAGTQKLVNTTPNLDRFVITPVSLEQAMKPETEYVIDIRTTKGGYAAAAQNTVGAGGTFDVTLIPENGIDKILVNGEDKTDSAIEQKDGTYGLKISNVRSDIDVQIYFSDVNSEATDAYIVNPGFGTGSTTGWTSAKANVEKTAENSYDGNYAVLQKGSRLSQTVSKIPTGSYYLGVYSRGSKGAAGIVKLKATVKSEGTTVNIYEKEINLSAAYEETLLNFYITEGMDVEVSIDTSGLKSGNVYLDNFSIKPSTDGRDMSKVDSSVLYFVDCSDNNVTTLPGEAKFGARNSVTDQYYGVDSNTGYKWGIATTTDDYPVDAQNNSGSLWTRWQAGRSWDKDDHDNVFDTWRCTDFQNKENGFNGTEKYIRYAFELEPGKYTVETGYYNMWGSAYGGQVTVKANGEKIETFNMADEAKDDNGNTADVPVKKENEVTVDENDGNKLLLSYERALEAGTLYISYIKITKAGENAKADLSKLTQLYQVAETFSNEGDVYDETSWNTMQTAKNAAKGYIEADSVELSQQAQVDECARTLESAINNLKTKESLVDSSLLYFVDCGDHDPRTVSSDGKMGTEQSLTDQVFMKDLQTGKEWGLVDKNNTNPRDYQQGNRVITNWMNSDGGSGDGSPVTDTFVFAQGQAEDLQTVGGKLYISYQFQTDLPDGTKCPVEVGFGNGWNNAANPVLYTNYEDENLRKQLTEDGFTVPGGGKSVFQGEAEVVNGYITLDIRSTVDDAHKTIQVNYISVGYPAAEAVTLTGLELTPPAKTSYKVDEELDTAGMAVKAAYSDGTEKELTAEDYTLRGFYSTMSGERKVTVSYRDGSQIATVAFDYTVTNDMSGIELASLPEKTKYVQGDVLDLTGLEVTAVYTDGTVRTLAADEYKVSGYDPEKAGEQEITVKVTDGEKEFTAVFQVTVEEKAVEEKELVEIKITPPAKTEYRQGEELDLTGLVVTGIYADGTEKVLDPTEYEVGGYDPDKVGPQMVRVTSGIRENYFQVTVAPEEQATLAEIQITPPDKTEYGWNEELDLTGLEVIATYTDGTTRILRADEYEVSGYDPTIAGEQEITVKMTDGEKEIIAVFQVIVEEKVIEDGVLVEIKITPPAKTEYKQGEELDLTGFRVIGIFEDGSERELEKGEYSIWGYNPIQLGEQIIQVTSGNTQAQEFRVVVVEETGSDPGNVDTNVSITEGAPQTVINNSPEDLYMVLTPEEREMVKNGASAKIWMEVKPLDESAIPEGTRKQMEDKAKEAVGQDGKLSYMDLSLFKQLTGCEAEMVYETERQLSVTVTIPEALRNTDTAKKRNYRIIRFHEDSRTGETYCDVLEGTYEEELFEYTFLTDRFSTYAIAYADTDIQDKPTEKVEITDLTVSGKTVYKVGETMGKDDLTVTALYSDGTTRILAREEYEIEGFDSSAPGTIQVMIRVGEFSKAMEVTIQSEDQKPADQTPEPSPDNEKPGNQEKPAKPGTQTSANTGSRTGTSSTTVPTKSVKTGDTEAIAIWLLMGLISVGTAAGVFVRRRKQFQR